MSEDEIIEYVNTLADVEAMTVTSDSGAPEVAWGDSFFFYDPAGTPADRRMPFATIVTKNYPGDTASELDRPDAFRLNIQVGSRAFESLLGYPPVEYEERSGAVDHAAIDRLSPHPVYATQGWVAIVNPGAATSGQARQLLAQAHDQALQRYRRRHGRTDDAATSTQ